MNVAARSWNRGAPWWFIPAVALGCAGEGPSYMPLESGRSWSYIVNSGLRRESVKVEVGPVRSVGGVPGRVLSSRVGSSALGWQGPRLIASELGNARFNPPVPLIDTGKIPSKRKDRAAEPEAAGTWKGKLESFGQIRPASGTLSQRRVDLKVAGRQIQAVESVLNLELKGATMEIRTWFERGRGIVKQEQYTSIGSSRKQVIRLELLQSD